MFQYENEALNNNIGHWETTLVGYHVLHLIYFNLVGYDLYHRYSIRRRSCPINIWI